PTSTLFPYTTLFRSRGRHGRRRRGPPPYCCNRGRGGSRSSCAPPWRAAARLSSLTHATGAANRPPSHLAPHPGEVVALPASLTSSEDHTSELQSRRD